MRKGFIFTINALLVLISFFCGYLTLGQHKVWGIGIFAFAIISYIAIVVFSRLHLRQLALRIDVIDFILAFREYEELHLSGIPKGSPAWFDAIQEFERRLENKPVNWKLTFSHVKEEASLEFEQSLQK
ncbi:hypothetical protein [Alicyclobacillus fodiniaquatilis]|uniref:Uncharacterized protein n=1 Tax=Alicyclobacillus fodiniaquatilis TaxID=1661150 RepID=A0ABW4JN64_9BACL